MTLVVLGIDALDPDLVDPEHHQALTLDRYESIETIPSMTGEPSTHELWPTIITGCSPDEHGLKLEDGVAWEHPLLRMARTVATYTVPDTIQTRVGAWLLNNTSEDAFRVPATYYVEHGLSTVFDSVSAKAIGIPNYVTNPDREDREHRIRREMGSLFERNPDTQGGHTSSDVTEFYERCMEMIMIRTARIRRAVRSRQFELVFGYTSGLDLIGHVSHDRPEMQEQAYAEANDFVVELLDDLDETDDLLLVSDHGLQDGLHTDEAMVASTDPELIDGIGSVTDVRSAIEGELNRVDHQPEPPWTEQGSVEPSERVSQQLEDLGYM
ncbi:alkaline phosphatase family protein [Halovivax cerinus]|uniref:Alkaline phosphatase family protein n=1 Tax=Halovivax cerinus TaxID=1487865 RepID=A0ABD5NJC8_9EURY|nr:alkaline phosphatase family protein [Halovivax cerinus]